MRDGVCEVDGNGAGLCGYPGPFAIVAEDLQSGDGLAEEEGDGAEIGVAGCLAVAAGFVFFRRALVVDHVAEMVFALLVVGVLVDEIFFVWELENDGEETEEGKNNIGMESFGENFDFGKVSLDERRLSIFAFEIFGEFGNVVDLDIVFDFSNLMMIVSSPAVVISIRIINFVLGFFVHGESEEILGECKLTIYLILRKTKVFDIEETDMVDSMFKLFGKTFFSTFIIEV